MRVQVRADEVENFILLSDHVGLQKMLFRVSSSDTNISFAVVEKDNRPYISSSRGSMPKSFFGWMSAIPEKTAVRKFQDEKGPLFYDFASRIGKSKSYLHFIIKGGPWWLPTSIGQNPLTVNVRQVFIVIPILTILAWLFSIPLSMAIARLTTREVDRLTRQLQEHTKQLEKQVEERTQQVQTSEKKYRLLADNTADIIWMLDLDLTFAYVSPSVQMILGYTPDDLTGMNLNKIMDKPTCERVTKVAADHLHLGSGKSVILIEIEAYHRDNHLVPLEITGRVLFDEEGKPIALQGTARDITKRRQDEEEKRLDFERFTTVMDSLDAIVYVADMDTHELLFLNASGRKHAGTDDVLGKPCWAILQSGQTGPCAFCTNNKLLNRDEKANEPFVWEFQNTGNGQWYECRDQAIRWTDGRMVRLEVAINIDKRKQADEKIKQRERYLTGLNAVAELLLTSESPVPYQAFLDQIGPASNASRAYIFINHRSPDGVLLTSQKAEWCAEGITSELNNPLLQNLSFEEWLPRWTDELMHGKIISGRGADFPAKERDFLEPQDIQALLLIPIIIDNEFIGFIGFDNCISDREWDSVEQTFLDLAANDLAQAIRRSHSEESMLASLHEKEILLREIHHRVKNNMQVIVSLLRMHARRTDDTRLNEVFDDCRTRINAMAHIHEALYESEDLSRIDFNTYLNKLCQNLRQIYAGLDNKITLAVKHCNVTLNMDQGVAVGMVISELISNTFKHAFQEDQAGSVSITLSSLNENDIELIIQDDGKGLPDEIDIHNTSSLGLRLAVAAVTRELNGSIEVERGVGTRFIIHFKSA